MNRIAKAIDQAQADRSTGWAEPSASGQSRSIRVAIGDPQASLDTFFGVLDANRLLGDDGRLRQEVQLVSMGDHFDWGEPHDRERAGGEGLALLSWLAAHPPDHVVLLVGNHDLARVGELVAFDQERFKAAQLLADPIYCRLKRREEPDPILKAEFKRRFPEVPTVEVVARDFASFTVAQRELVTALLRGRRFRAAIVAGQSFLLCHAGVTSDDLEIAGVPPDRHCDAEVVAAALNGCLDRAVEQWLAGPGGRPFSIAGLHHPGDGGGEGRGIFYHRPSNPDHEGKPELFAGPPRRRFDPRRLPLGLTQAIGQIADEKCRDLLGDWADRGGHRPGVLRHLETDGASVRYAHGLPASQGTHVATMLFLDGAMREARIDEYELLDLSTARVLRAR